MTSTREFSLEDYLSKVGQLFGIHDVIERLHVKAEEGSKRILEYDNEMSFSNNLQNFRQTVTLKHEIFNKKIFYCFQIINLECSYIHMLAIMYCNVIL